MYVCIYENGQNSVIFITIKNVEILLKVNKFPMPSTFLTQNVFS